MIRSYTQDEVFYKSPISLVRYDYGKNIVVKKLLQRKLPSYWYKTYCEFQENFTDNVKVLQADEDSFTMEYIPHHCNAKEWLDKAKLKDVPFGHQQKLDLFKKITKTFNDGLTYSRRLNNEYWAHCDLDVYNFIVTEDYSFRLIDPDSWNIVNKLPAILRSSTSERLYNV